MSQPVECRQFSLWNAVNHLLDRLVVVLRVDAVCRAHLLGNLELCWVCVDCVDVCGALHLAAVDDGEADGAQAKDCARRALLDAGSVDGRAEA